MKRDYLDSYLNNLQFLTCLTAVRLIASLFFKIEFYKKRNPYLHHNPKNFPNFPL